MHTINNPQPGVAKVFALVLLTLTMTLSWAAHAGNVVTSTDGGGLTRFEEDVQIGVFDTSHPGANFNVLNGGTCAMFKMNTALIDAAQFGPEESECREGLYVKCYIAQGAATASIFIHLAATFMLYTTLCGCGSEKDRAAWRNRTTMVARATWLLVGCYTIVFSIWLSIFTGEPPCPIDLMPENSGSYTGESGESGSETTETPMNRVCVDTTGFCGAFSNGDRLASNDGRGKEGDFFIIGEGMELYIACSLLLTGAALLLVYERSFESWYWGCQATRREMRLGALALKPGDQCVAIFNYSDENGCIKIGDVGIVNGHNTFTLPGPSFSSRRGAVATTGTAMERINCTFPAYNGAVNLQPGRAGGVKPVGDGVQIRPVSDGVHIRPVASHNGVNHGVRLDSTQVTIEIAPQPMNPNTPSATVRAAQRSPAAQALHTLLRAYYAEFAPGAKTDAALGKMAETIVWKGSMDAKDAKFKAKYGISLTEFRAAQQIDIPSRVTGNNAFDDTMAGFDDFDI